MCQSKRVPGGMGKSATTTAWGLGFVSGSRHSMSAYALGLCLFGRLASVDMNENHAKLMPSPEWAAYIQDEVLPRADSRGFARA